MHQARHDADSYQRVEVITGLRRRRDWSDAEKARILAESADPGVNISEVARRNGVSRGLLRDRPQPGGCYESTWSWGTRRAG